MMQEKKVLIIDDDLYIRQLVDTIFDRVGAETVTADSGQQGLRLLYEHRPDLVILDILMPHTSGWEICEQIRALSDIPIIMLTSLTEEANVVRGLDCGAIDYVTKPFSANVLLARARAALRQVQSASPGPAAQHRTTFDDGYLSIDLDARQVRAAGESVNLTKTEFALLEYLFRNAGIALTFDQILGNVWGWEYEGSTEYVHVYASRLRRKLEEDPKRPVYLQTEYGVGYRFVFPIDG